MRSFPSVALFWVAALFGFVPLSQAEEDPFDMPPAGGKRDSPQRNHSRGRQRGQEWLEQLQHSDFVSETVTFGPPGCPVVLAGTRVVEIATGKERMEVERDFSGVRMAAFSDNGQYLATGWKANDGSGKISVYDTIKGEKSV